MTDEVRALFDEYTERFHRGEHPDPVAYLERAGGGRDTLVKMIDAFLTDTPPPDPDPAMVAVVDAWMRGESPLLELRKAKGMRPAEVVDALVAGLDLPADKHRKVARYYHRLENGLLDVSRVDARVLTTLAKALGAKLGDLMFGAARPAFPHPPAAAAPASAGGAYLRSSAEAEEVLEIRISAFDAGPDDRDEVDDLFEGPR